jgi:hypothetical protein
MNKSIFVSIVWFNNNYDNLNKLLSDFLKNTKNKITIGVCLSCNKDHIDKIVCDYSDKNVKFIPLPNDVSRYSYGRYLTQQMITNEMYYFHTNGIINLYQNWDEDLISIHETNTIMCHCEGYPYVKKMVIIDNCEVPLLGFSDTKSKTDIYLDNCIFTESENIKDSFHKTNLDKFWINEIMSMVHKTKDHKMSYVNLSELYDFKIDESIPKIPEKIDKEIPVYMKEYSKLYKEIFATNEKVYQILFEFSEYVLKKIDTKTWLVNFEDSELEFEEVGNDYKSHTLKNSECMFRIMRNGEALYDYMNNTKLATNGNVFYDTKHMIYEKQIKVNKTKSKFKMIVNNSIIDSHYKNLALYNNSDIKFIKMLKLPIDELKLALDTYEKCMYIHGNVVFVGKSLALYSRVLSLLSKYDIVYAKVKNEIVLIMMNDTQAAKYILNSGNIDKTIQENPNSYKMEISYNNLTFNDRKYFGYVEEHPKMKDKLESFQKLSSKRLKKI